MKTILNKILLKTKGSSNLFVAFALLSILSLCACDRSTLINRNFRLPEKGWTRNEYIPFHFVVKDTSLTYRLYFSLRHSQEYPFSNAFFLLYTRFPDHQVKIDTIECILADYSGRWIGNGVGSHRNAQFLVKSTLKFPLSGEYTLKVRQALRIDTIRDISNIGIKILPN